MSLPGPSDALRHGPAPAPAHSPGLRERYEQYRAGQGRELLNVIPREGIRSLIRSLRERGHPAPPVNGDTLEWLATRCAELLPLPPFEVWARDFYAARHAYEGLPGPPLAPETGDGEPVTVEVRGLRHDGREWMAALALRPLGRQWVGHIRFHPSGEARVFTTGDIFRETSPVAVRRRFRGFDDHTLGAFLRSCLG